MVVNVSFKCDERFKKLLDRRAVKHGVSVSDYIRNTVVFESVMECDMVAFRMLSDDVRVKVREMALKFVQVA
jgi:hypothetical protein